MYLRVLVRPGAKKETVNQRTVDRLSLDVRAPAIAGAANKRAQEMIARHLGVSKESVRLISGHHSANKLFSIKQSLR